ncbi:hypothetical protein MPLA_930011 [Mesorhizobium sp. ORS 3359]|nr:hypothetical protein MPLA_930011 [Mesorhizobium sp. ORS 3359]
MGRGGRNSTRGIRNPFPASHQGLDWLQSDGKSASHLDFARQTKIENTVRYLGVDVEAALELSAATEV